MNKLSILVLLVLVTPPLGAAEQVLSLAPASTEITFSLGATGHTVHGSFQLREGRVRFDPASGAMSGRIVVDATSGETANDKRDRSMHRKVLESEKFPEFVFDAQRVEGRVEATGSSDLRLHGTLSLHGDVHPMTLPMRVVVDGARVTVSAAFSVPFVEWGLRDPSVLFLRVAKVVDVTVSATGTLSPADD